MRLRPTAMFTVCLALAVRAGAQQVDSAQPGVGDSSVRLHESRLALQASTEENVRLKERLLIQENAIRALTESLAISNSESEIFKREASDLRLKIETLGIESVSGDRAKIEQRLLAAVRDLRLSQKANEDLKRQMTALSDATLAFLSSAGDVDPQSRMALETEVRRSNDLLSETGSAKKDTSKEGSLKEGSVIDVKADISLVVADLGSRQGVKVGMPFHVWRGKERVGEVRVVDVRDRIAGAVVQNLTPPTETVKVGDHLRIATQSLINN